MIFPKRSPEKPRPSWRLACLWLCLPALLSGCMTRPIVQPERVEVEVRKWIPVPAHRVTPLPYLAPPATLEACLTEFAPTAYSIIEQAQKDRTAVRNLEEPEDGT